MRFLEEIPLKTDQELLESLALSPHCGEEKKSYIVKRWRRLSWRFQQEPGEFRVAKEREEQGVNLILVEWVSRLFPTEVEVVRMVMIPEEESWLPAPVSGSFENVRRASLAKVVASTEEFVHWLQKERLSLLEGLALSGKEKIKQGIKEAVSVDLLEQGKPREILQGFLRACRNKDYLAGLAYLGDVDVDLLEDDYSEARSILRKGLRGELTNPFWEVVLHPQSLFLVESERNEFGELGVVLMDPQNYSVPIRLLFEVYEEEGRSYVNLPIELRKNDVDDRFVESVVLQNKEEEHVLALNQLGVLFEELCPKKTQLSMDQLGEEFLDSANQGRLKHFLQLFVQHSDDVAGVKSERLSAVLSLWAKLTGKQDHANLIFLTQKKKGDYAAFILAQPSLKPLEEWEPLLMLGKEQEYQKWAFLVPSSRKQNEESPSIDELVKWFRESSDDARQRLIQQVSLSSRKWNKKVEWEEITEEESVKAFELFLQSAEKEKWLENLRSLVRFHEDDSSYLQGWQKLVSVSKKVEGKPLLWKQGPLGSGLLQGEVEGEKVSILFLKFGGRVMISPDFSVRSAEEWSQFGLKPEFVDQLKELFL